MDAIDNAIRNALAKGDASDRAFREKVYRSIFAALEKASESNDQVSPELAAKRREALANRVREIESEFIRLEHHVPEPETLPETVAEEEKEDAGADSAQSEEPDFDESLEQAVPEADFRQTPDRRARFLDDEDDEPVFSRKRRPFTLLLIVSLVVAAVGIGIWWTNQSGILLSPSQRDTGVPNPPRKLAEEEFRPEPAGQVQTGEAQPASHDWVGVFAPNDPATAIATSGATAEIVGSGKDQLLRIRSATGEAAVMFDVGQGVLEQISGRKAIFNIVAASAEGQPTEMSVRCNFGNLGDCARRRFNVGPTPSDYLFEIDLPDEQPGAAGTLAIVSDVSGSGLTLDIREIKVTIAP